MLQRFYDYDVLGEEIPEELINIMIHLLGSEVPDTLKRRVLATLHSLKGHIEQQIPTLFEIVQRLVNSISPFTVFRI